MEDTTKDILSKQILLAEQVIRSANEATFFKEECNHVKFKTEKLASLLLRMVDHANSQFNDRPTHRIIDDSQQVLETALSLVLKCRSKALIKRTFVLVSTTDFRKTCSCLENSIGDITWLLRLSLPDGDNGEYLGLPPIASNDPILCLIWEQIVVLNTGSMEDRSDAAASLLSLARDNYRYRKMILEEGGVGPLLKLLKEGNKESQMIVARAIGVICCDSESVQRVIETGVCKLFAKILKEGFLEVQAMVAEVISIFASSYPSCQDIFAQNNIVRLLINHLASGVVQEHVPNVIVINKATSVLAIVMARNHLNTSKEIEEYDVEKPNQSQDSDQPNVSLSGTSFKGGHVVVENEDPETKTNMKAMAAKALCDLLKGNPSLCRTIIDSRALMSFIVLLELGSKDVQCHSSLALMEITAIVEEDSDLRRTTFRHSSPVCKIVVDQLVKILQREDQDLDLLIPCIKSIGNLAKIFRVAEARIIVPLVNLLDNYIYSEVANEALITLAKFACKENILHQYHSKSIIQAGGAKHLIQLIFFADQIVQHSALLLLCYITLHVPYNEELVHYEGVEVLEVLDVLKWASKQSFVTQDETLDSLLSEARAKLQHFQFFRDLRASY